MAANGPNVQAGLKQVLEEIRDLKVVVRKALDQAAEDRKRSDEERRRSDDRFEQMLQKFSEDSERRDERMARAWTEVRQAGKAIVKTLNGHTKLLKGIHRALYAGRNGRNGNGRSRK